MIELEFHSADLTQVSVKNIRLSIRESPDARYHRRAHDLETTRVLDDIVLIASLYGYDDARRPHDYQAKMERTITELSFEIEKNHRELLQ